LTLSPEDGLYRNERGAIWVPDVDTLRREILQELHDSPYGGHLGVARTYEQMTRLFTWPQLARSVEQFVHTCHVCQRDKFRREGARGLLQPLPIPGRRWESVGMDFITALPETAAKNTQIVVFVDRLTKMVHLDALAESADAEVTARCFVRNVFRLHGLPSELISDRDSKFTGGFWSECMRLLGTSRRMSTAYHPQSDGQVERTNATLEDMLRHWVSPALDNWDTLLDCAEFAINNAYNKATGSTPFRLNYGQDPQTPLSLDLEARLPTAADFVGEMRSGLVMAKKALAAAQSRQKDQHDKGRKEQILEVGQQVLLNARNLKFKNSKGRKLMPQWLGPFKVTERIGLLAYRLQLPPTLPVHDVFHTSLLRPFHSDGRYQPPPLPVAVAGELEYLVEEVIAHRGEGRLRRYLVKWTGYGAEHNSWEPARNLTNAPEKVTAYLTKYGITA
jgi:hypothetical protein